jgi:uncharacterized membrane protein YesL
MNFLDSSWYWWANRLSSYLLLSVLWLLCSAPILTLFPATVALFAVFRAWQENPDEAFYQPFFAHLRRYFWGDFALGLLWLLSAALLTLNLLLLPAAIPSDLLRALAFGTWLLGALVFASGSIFIFPLRANYTLGLWASVRAAVALGLSRLVTTLLCLGVLTLTSLLFLYIPASLLLSGAGAGHLISWLCTRTLKKLETQSAKA